MEEFIMKTRKVKILITMCLGISFLMSSDYTLEQKQTLGQKAMHEMLQKIFSESMKAKRAFLDNQSRADDVIADKKIISITNALLLIFLNNVYNILGNNLKI